MGLTNYPNLARIYPPVNGPYIHSQELTLYGVVLRIKIEFPETQRRVLIKGHRCGGSTSIKLSRAEIMQKRSQRFMEDWPKESSKCS